MLENFRGKTTDSRNKHFIQSSHTWPQTKLILCISASGLLSTLALLHETSSLTVKALSVPPSVSQMPQPAGIHFRQGIMLGWSNHKEGHWGPWAEAAQAQTSDGPLENESHKPTGQDVDWCQMVYISIYYVTYRKLLHFPEHPAPKETTFGIRRLNGQH